MCLILDANKYGDFLDPDNVDMQPVKDWLDKYGNIAYSPTPKFTKELTRKMKERFDEYNMAGKIKRINRKKVEDRQQKLPNMKSNDPHIIALAIEAKVRLLVSSDRDLHEDFKNIIGGSIYQDRSHKKLLIGHKCP